MGDKKMKEHEDDAKRQRKTTLCCLSDDKSKGCNSKKWIIVRFAALFFIFVLILCIVYGLKTGMKDKHGVK